jgi:hypothetical protein
MKPMTRLSAGVALAAFMASAAAMEPMLPRPAELLILPSGAVAQSSNSLLERNSPERLDAAASERVWLDVLDHFPELTQGPRREGTYVVDRAVLPDGTLAINAIHYAAGPQELAALSINATRSLAEGTVTVLTRSRGTTLPDRRTLGADVRIQYRAAPAQWDASRSVDLVRRAVLRDHRQLLLANGKGYNYRVTVVMDEEGGIAREKVELIDTNAGGMPARLDLTSFEKLGLPSQDVGVMGSTNITQFDAQGGAAATVGADGILRGFEMPSIRSISVLYAWPRRPGEPVGGRPSPMLDVVRAYRPMAAAEAAQSSQMVRLAQQYFPEGGPRTGNWMLMSASGEVLRTGHVDLAAGELLTTAWIEQRFPEVRIAESHSMGFAASSPGPQPAAQGTPFRTSPVQVTSVDIFTLAPDSPAPRDPP